MLKFTNILIQHNSVLVLPISTMCILEKERWCMYNMYISTMCILEKERWCMYNANKPSKTINLLSSWLTPCVGVHVV